MASKWWSCRTGVRPGCVIVAKWLVYSCVAVIQAGVVTGVFVALPRAPGLPDSDGGEGPFELIRARRMVEGGTAARAARQATAEELGEIRAAVDDLQRAQEASR